MATNESARPATTAAVVPAYDSLIDTMIEYLPVAVCLIRGNDLQVLRVNSRYQAVVPVATPGQIIDARWPDPSHDFATRCRAVLARGDVSGSEDLPVLSGHANNGCKPACFSGSLRRILLPAGQGWGLLHTLWETAGPQLVPAQLRRAADLNGYRLRLTDALRPLADPVDIQETATRLLADQLGANRAAYFEVQGSDYVIVRDIANGLPSITGRFPIASFGERLWHDLQRGVTVRVADLARDAALSAAERSAYAALEIGAYIGVPLLKGGHFVAGLTVHMADSRAWTDDEIVLVEETAERTWAAVERARAEAAVAASEARYRTVVESSREGIMTVDMEGHFQIANRAYQEMLGYTLEELQGLTCSQLTPPRWHDYEMSLIQDRILPLGDSGEYEKEYIRKDGSVFPVSLRTWCIRDAAGHPIGMQAIVRDITARKQTEAALQDSIRRERQRAEELQTVFDTAPIGLAIALDPRGLHIHGNEANEQLLGVRHGVDLSVKQPGAAPFKPLVNGREMTAEEMPMQRAVRGEKVPGQTFDVRCGDGRSITVYAKATPLFDEAGSPRGAVGAFLDITALKEAEQKLRAAHDTFRHLVENSPFGVYVVDADFRLVQVSAGAQKVFANVQPLLGRDFAEILRSIWAEPFASEAIGRFRHTLATGEPYHAPTTTERRRDIPMTESYDWKIERLALPDGRDGVVCHFYDLSERQRYEAELGEREERFRAVYEHAGTGIAITDHEGRFEQGNPAYCQLLGYTEAELRELVFLDLVHPDDRPANLYANERLYAGDIPFFEIENRYLRKDGGIVWVHKVVSVLRDRDNRPARHVALVTDVTERRRMENTLREADQRKDEFLATLAHELRNPLAPLSSALQVLDRRGSADPLTLQLQKMMNRQVIHLTRLVNDLLEVSRITRGKIELQIEQVDLREVVRQAIETSEPLLTANKHELQLELPEAPLRLAADPVRLAQVFTNLLNNAAKYTEPGGIIRLHGEQRGDVVLVRVSDNGIGIDTDMLPRVFDLFTQADVSLHRARGGLGIGLTLVRHLVQLHGGEIEAFSAGPNRGSEFVIRLPLNQTALPHLHSVVESGVQTGACRRLLIVDDNRDAADSLALLLQNEVTDVEVAYEGHSAIESLSPFKPHVVLLDLGMPGMSGIETARRIRAHPDGRHCKIIAVTGWGQEEDRRQTINAGFDAHLVKPLDIWALEALLASTFKPEPQR